MGVRGDSMVSRGWRLSLRRPKAEPEGVRAESYEPNHNHCGECPFKKGCAKNAGKIFE